MQQLKQNIPEAQRANPFRRAWNHLKDLEKSPVLKYMDKLEYYVFEATHAKKIKPKKTLIERNPVPALARAAKFGNAEVRAIAMKRLGEIDGKNGRQVLEAMKKDSKPMLMEALKDADENVRISALLSLVRIAPRFPSYGWGDVLPTLAETIKQKSGRERAAACTAAKVIAERASEVHGWPTVMGALIWAIRQGGDEEEHVQKSACEALKAIANEYVGEVGIELVSTAIGIGRGDPKIEKPENRRIVGVLNEILLRWLREGGSTMAGSIRRNAGRALGYTADMSLFPVLFAELRDKHSTTGPDVVNALAGIGARYPKEMAARISEEVNGKLGDELLEINIWNDRTAWAIREIMLECGKAMEREKE